MHDGGFRVLGRLVGMPSLAMRDGFLQFLDALIQVRILDPRGLRMFESLLRMLCDGIGVTLLAASALQVTTASAHGAMEHLKEHFRGASAMGIHALTTLPFFLAVAGVAAVVAFGAASISHAQYPKISSEVNRESDSRRAASDLRSDEAFARGLAPLLIEVLPALMQASLRAPGDELLLLGKYRPLKTKSLPHHKRQQFFRRANRRSSLLRNRKRFLRRSAWSFASAASC